MKFCTFASGSSGNCAMVEGGKTRLLIDAGISMRRITAALREIDLCPCDVSGILVTHEHSDHVCGLRMMTKHHGLHIYTSLGVAEGLVRASPELEPYLRVFRAGEGFSMGGVDIRSFSTPHDTPESVGYRFEFAGRSLVFATDLGHVPDSVLNIAAGADAAVIESNHDILMLRTGGYPYYLKRRILSDRGHLSNDACGDFAAALARSGTRRIVLAHLSRDNNTPGTARRTVCAALNHIGAAEAVELCVAPADMASALFQV